MSYNKSRPTRLVFSGALGAVPQTGSFADVSLYETAGIYIQYYPSATAALCLQIKAGLPVGTSGSIVTYSKTIEDGTTLVTSGSSVVTNVNPYIKKFTTVSSGSSNFFEYVVDTGGAQNIQITLFESGSGGFTAGRAVAHLGLRRKDS